MLSVNPRLLEMTGYAESDLIGQSVDLLVPQRKRATHVAHRTQYVAHPVLRPMGSGLDIVCQRKDGSIFHADIALSPVKIDGDPVIVAAVRDATQRRSLERARRDAEERLHLLEQQERLGRDLHDGIIQSVFAVGMSLQALLSRVTDPMVVDRLTQSIRALDDTITELRGFIFGLGTLTTAEETRAGLERLVAEARSQSGIQVSGVIDADALARVGEHGQVLLLVAREALSNVRRHSMAEHCELALRLHGDAVELTVTDDGRGFDTTAPTGGLGLANAHARAHEIGADHDVTSSPSGTVVRFRLVPAAS
jgi:PAS domain S-box-containing protein